VERRNTQIAMMFIKIVTVVVCFCIGDCAYAGQLDPQDCGTPLWSEEAVPNLSRSDSYPHLLDSSRAGVAFLGNQQLIAYGVTLDPGKLSSREGPEISSPFRLRLSLLDANSGILEFSKEWGTRFRDTSVQVTSGGVLVKTGGLAKLYSRDFAQARDLPLPIDSNERYDITVSASGKTILINRIFRRSGTSYFSHLDVLDAKTLDSRYSWDHSPPVGSNYSISDEGAVIATSGSGTSGGSIVIASEFGDSNSSVLLNNSRSGCLVGQPTLVPDGALVLQSCNDLLFLTKTGMSYSLGSLEGRSSGKTAVAQNGRFVAISIDTIEVKRHIFTENNEHLTARHIAIYDLLQKKRILSVNVNPLPKTDYDFTLSPDGSKLAILMDRTVSVCSVPVQSIKRDYTPNLEHNLPN
jgi:hypothetical protein